MAFIDSVLQTPSYGWQHPNGELIIPTKKQLFQEFAHRVNIFRSRRNWISFMGWAKIVCMTPFLYYFLAHSFTLVHVALFLVYALIIMGTHGTIWFHRYCTHHSFRFSHPFFRWLTQNLVISTVPEEMYVVSHHVHHAKSDQPGDPYNPKAGFWYCFLADVNHQGISKELSEKDYRRVQQLLKHTGVPLNSFQKYQKWGSAAAPGFTLALWLVNWALWFTLFYLLGGPGLACTLFSAAMVWFIGVRIFNYTGHGKGEEKHKDGLDFDRSNLSINQWRPGYFAGEWHNNHHLFPGSARAGFLPGQLDVPWLYIQLLHRMGAVTSFHDSKAEFLKKYGSRLEI